jgi:hypothetical protein
VPAVKEALARQNKKLLSDFRIENKRYGERRAERDNR